MGVAKWGQHPTQPDSPNALCCATLLDLLLLDKSPLVPVQAAWALPATLMLRPLHVQSCLQLALLLLLPLCFGGSSFWPWLLLPLLLLALLLLLPTSLLPLLLLWGILFLLLPQLLLAQLLLLMLGLLHALLLTVLLVPLLLPLLPLPLPPCAPIPDAIGRGYV